MIPENCLLCAYTLCAAWLSVLADGDICDASPTDQNENVYKLDPATGQLSEYAATHKNISCILTADGRPEDSETASLRAGYRGPVLLQDTNLIDLLAHFNRERVPTRRVHGKGAGASGYFKVTNDITKYCKASIFEKVGKECALKARFSIAGPSDPGMADSIREIRGFAIKFCTDEGTWDLVGNNVPVFFINDGIKFPSLIHTQGRNPVTNLRDANMMWDFITKNNESCLTIMQRFSALGVPRNFRTMNGHGVNTFKLVNASGATVWCKFHYLTDQKLQNLTAEESEKLAATDPDSATRDLYDAIHKGNYPSWTMYIQVMTEEEADKVPFYPFDPSREWPQNQFPYIPVGTIVLNQNPENYFAYVESFAACPSNMPPGIEASPDPVLQSRLFAYKDTQRYRLGVNFNQLPGNACPFTSKITNYQRDGYYLVYDQDKAPNYYPNSFNGPVPCARGKIAEFNVCGTVQRSEYYEDDSFEQPRAYWHSLTQNDQNDMITAIVTSVRQASLFVQGNVVRFFGNVDQTFASTLKSQLDEANANPPPPTEQI